MIILLSTFGSASCSNLLDQTNMIRDYATDSLIDPSSGQRYCMNLASQQNILNAQAQANGEKQVDHNCVNCGANKFKFNKCTYCLTQY